MKFHVHRYGPTGWVYELVRPNGSTLFMSQVFPDVDSAFNEIAEVQAAASAVGKIKQARILLNTNQRTTDSGTP